LWLQVPAIQQQQQQWILQSVLNVQMELHYYYYCHNFHP
jgi:Leu/Phe-tRNA-protein transferase